MTIHEVYFEKQSRARQQIIPMMTGGLVGLAASIPMGLVMIGLNRILPGRERAPLPPKQITARAARRAGVQKVVPPGQKWGLATWLAHLGYGATAASLYNLVTRPLRLPSVVRGMLFALAVWAGSYLGWLPALSILPPATEQSGRRNLIMISSHLVWGSLVGLVTGRLEEKPEMSLLKE